MISMGFLLTLRPLLLTLPPASLSTAGLENNYRMISVLPVSSCACEWEQYPSLNCCQTSKGSHTASDRCRLPHTPQRQCFHSHSSIPSSQGTNTCVLCLPQKGLAILSAQTLWEGGCTHTFLTLSCGVSLSARLGLPAAWGLALLPHPWYPLESFPDTGL
jgi:hypothetical protein